MRASVLRPWSGDMKAALDPPKASGHWIPRPDWKANHREWYSRGLGDRSYTQHGPASPSVPTACDPVKAPPVKRFLSANRFLPADREIFIFWWWPQAIPGGWNYSFRPALITALSMAAL